MNTQQCSFVAKSIHMQKPNEHETNYSNIERETVDILHGVEKIHHYCFTCTVNMITDLKPLVAILSKDVACLSCRLQRILLQIHQYNMRILYKSGLQLFIATGYPDITIMKDEEIQGRCITINTTESCIDISDCTKVEEIKIATLVDEHIGMLSEPILCGWPLTKAETPKELQPYWPFRDEISIIDGSAMKVRRRIIPKTLLRQSTKIAAPNPHEHRGNKAAGTLFILLD